MRQDFNPGHSLETPILPERKKFSLKGGNIEYQITNFALSLAYALTAHKCQGETLDTIIIDFGGNWYDKFHLPRIILCYINTGSKREKCLSRSFDES